MNNKPLSGKVAIITGAGSGIGREISKIFAENGAIVALDGRTEEKLIVTQKEIKEAGGEAEVFPINISTVENCEKLISSVVEKFGRLDILVNNATYTIPNRPPELDKFWETETDYFDNSYKVNVIAPFVLCRAAIAHMRKQSIGHIINIGAVQSRRLYAGGFAYSATKVAARTLSIILSKEIRKEADIRISVLNPAGVGTKKFFKYINSGEVRPDLKDTKMIEPVEMAEAALYLVTRVRNGVVDELTVRRQDADYFCFE